jgi:hypothetical protein
MEEYKIPTGPGIKVKQQKKEDIKFTRNDQEDYKYGLRLLLYLLMYSIPDVK